MVISLIFKNKIIKMGAKVETGSVLLIVFQIIQSVSSFKCYVCAPDKGKPEDIYTLKKSFPDHSVQYCSTYTADSINKFLLECPSGGSGCLTKFEANGSVMRNCAPIAFEECKEANGVNYCYCKNEGCNTPDRRLSDPYPNNFNSSKLGEAKAAARVSTSDKSFTRYFDDEDFVEGSGDWGDFYYDDYNYLDRSYDYPETYGDDEDGVDGVEGAFDGSDVTDPPPYLDLEYPVEHKVDADAKHKYDRDRFRNTHNDIRRPDSSDFSIDDGTESIHSATTKPKTSNSHSVTYFFCHHLLAVFLLILIKSEILVGI